MTLQPTHERNLDGYDHAPLAWSDVHAALSGEELTQAPGTGGPNRFTCWLATIDADGAPHVTGIGSLWHDDQWWIVTGEDTRKGRNLNRDPRCSISVALHDYDLVVEGRAERVTDPDTLERVATLFRDGGWPAEVDAEAQAFTAPYSAQSAGPPPWSLYALHPFRVYALGTTGDGGAMRYDLEG